MTEPASPGPVIYVDRSDVREGGRDELEDRIRELVAFVDRHQPQMTSYGFYFDEDANEMTVLSVHPDSSSLERHIALGGAEFEKLHEFLQLREIEVFGSVSERAVELVRLKANALGHATNVTLHEQFAGFGRVTSSRHA